MRRIVILGCAGSGKSTLARLLGERLAMPVFHLDQMFWQPGWAKPSDELFDRRVREAVAGESWVIEGNYDRRTFKWRLPRADTLIWMDTPRITCLRRVLGRTWRGVRGEQRADMAPGCAEALDAAYLAFCATSGPIAVSTCRASKLAWPSSARTCACTGWPVRQRLAIS